MVMGNYTRNVVSVTDAEKPLPSVHGIGPIWIDGVEYWSNGVSFNKTNTDKSKSNYIESFDTVKIAAGSIAGESPLSTHTDVIASFDAEFDGVTYPFGQVTKVTLQGTTILGNSLFAYEFEPTFYDKTLIILAGVHGTEINTHSPLRKFLEHFVANPDLYSSLARTRIVVAPMMNPDGFRISRGNGNTPPVDINRNYLVGGDYPTAWDSFSTGGEFYKGVAAFSEVESQAVRWMFEQKYSDVSYLIDFHNFGDNIDANFGILGAHSLSNNPLNQVAMAVHSTLPATDKWYLVQQTVTPNPTSLAYAQERSIWSIAPEIGISRTDTSLDVDMTKVVNLYANIVLAMVAQKDLDLATYISPYAISLQRHHTNLTVPTTADYALLDNMTVSYTPKVDSTFVGVFSGVAAPGGDNISTLYVAPEIYQGTDNPIHALSEQVSTQGEAGNSRRPFSGSFSRDVVAGTQLNIGIKTKTVNKSGSVKLARLGLIGILIPKSSTLSPTLLTDNASDEAEIFSYEYSGEPVVIPNSSSYSDVVQVEQNITTRVAGILIMQLEATFNSGNSGTLYMSAAAGNGLALIGNEGDSDQRSKNERYINQIGRKETITSYVIQQCLPSSINSSDIVAGTTPHKIGLRCKITSGTGTCELVGYKMKAYFIPAALGTDQMQWHVHDAGVVSQIF